MTERIFPTEVGANGEKGALDLFPASRHKGKTRVTMADNAGQTTTAVVFAEQAAARTYTVPDAGADAVFAMMPAGSTLVTASTAELNILDGATLTVAELNKLAGIPASVTVVVTTPGASGTCDAAFTFKDAAGATIAIPAALTFYLSASTGLTLTAAITSILAADTPVGGVGVLTTGQSGILVTTAAGLASVKLTGAAATSYFITFIGPGGRLIVSPALLTKA